MVHGNETLLSMLIINITPSFLSKTPGRVVFSTRCVEEMKSNTAHVFLILLYVLSETTETRGREGGGGVERAMIDTLGH